MFLSASGLDDSNQLGIDPSSVRNPYESMNTRSCSISDVIKVCVNTLTRIPFNINGIQCISGGSHHSVIIKDNRVFAAGNDQNFSIGSDFVQKYEYFTEIEIIDEPISWAACGNNFTLYLTVSGKAILCHAKAQEKRIIVKHDKKAVSVFAGSSYGGIIDEEGAILILDKENPHILAQICFLGVPAIDLVCCENFICALTVDGRFYAKNYSSNEFVEVLSLSDMKLKKLSGYNDTAAALTSDGLVYMYGKNDRGQLGDGTTKDNYSDFTMLQVSEPIKDISCSDHTILITESNKVLGFGNNEFYQLLAFTNESRVLFPTQISEIKADHVITCGNHTFVLSGTGPIENPAKVFFMKYNNHTIINELPEVKNGKENDTNDAIFPVIEEQKRQNDQLNEKIESLLAICQTQSQSINQLMGICCNLQHQNEVNKREILIQSRKIQELQNQNNAMNSKLDKIAKYIDEQDFY